MQKIHKTIGFLGCGNMGAAVLNGLCEQKLISRHNVVVYDTDKKKCARIKKQNHVVIADSIESLFTRADIIILAVKPQTLPKISVALPKKEMKKKVLVSILAGVASSAIKKQFATTNVVRVMPNLGAMLGEGISVVAMNRFIKPRDFSIILNMFSSCGDVVQLQEKHFDVVTAVSGSGPAYYFYMTELLTAQAVRRGIPHDVASTLAKKTASAAASMMNKDTYEPDELRRMVTSKGGTTEAALKRFKKEHFEGAFNHGIDAAIKRGEQLRKKYQ